MFSRNKKFQFYVRMFPPSAYIVTFLGFFENPNGIVMKMYEGTLKDLLFQSDTTLTMSNIKQMAFDIASGCKLIHSMGLIHFDIKPHNILVERVEDSDEIRCAITDFGVPFKKFVLYITFV